MKRLLVAIISLWLFLGAAASDSVLDRVARSVVALENTRGQIYCSGFVIDDELEYVQTALHCIEFADENEWSIVVDGHTARLVSVSPQYDLAVLQVETDRPRLKPTTQAIVVGLPVTGIGHALGFRTHLTFAPTTVVNPDYVIKRLHMLLVRSAFAGGMSGGPVVDSDGNVVSIIQQYNNDGDFGTPVGILLALEGQFWRR